MLGVILRDQFPEIKVQVSQLISELSKAMKEEIGKYAKQIIESLCLNMKHQHNKIRKISIISLVDLLLCNEAGNLIDECIPAFTAISNDKNKETLTNMLINAINNPKTPNDILLTILNLILFMERRNINLSFIDYNKFGNVSNKCRAFAKALYYKENYFLIKNDFEQFEDLLEL